MYEYSLHFKQKIKEKKRKENTEKLKIDEVYSQIHGDGLGTLITHVQLKKDNYNEWVDTIKLALEA